MKRSLRLVLFCAVLLTLQPAFGQELKPITLPAPDKKGGKPLMQALNERKTIREFSGKELPPQVLSNLLWAAFGVNRPDGKRTAPSASNKQEIDIYVAMAKGLYLYNAKEHRLDPVLEGDVRPSTGSARLVKDTPVVLVFVADYARMGGNKDFYSAIDTGYISQNVYLYCASEGLATVALGVGGQAVLVEKMKLRPDQKVILTQPVGYQR